MVTSLQVRHQEHWKCPKKVHKTSAGFSQYSYQDRLQSLSLPSLELRRLLHDLILCYKIIFGLINVQCDEFFAFTACSIKSGPLCIFSITFSNVDRFEQKLHQCIRVTCEFSLPFIFRVCVWRGMRFWTTMWRAACIQAWRWLVH